jgi:hypothetical protein
MLKAESKNFDYITHIKIASTNETKQLYLR